MQVLSYDNKTAYTMRVGGGMTYSALWRAATALGMSWKVNDVTSAYQMDSSPAQLSSDKLSQHVACHVKN